MKTRNMTQSAILLAIGTILHLIPGFVNGVKPDFMLVCVFIAIMLDSRPSTVISVGVAGGILAGLTTSMPGGFVPNVIDKIISSIFVYLLTKLFTKNESNLKDTINKAIIFFTGTFVSGFVFLAVMILTVGLPGNVGMTPMLMAIVLPTSLMNVVVGIFFMRILKSKVLKQKLA